METIILRLFCEHQLLILCPCPFIKFLKFRPRSASVDDFVTYFCSVALTHILTLLPVCRPHQHVCRMHCTAAIYVGLAYHTTAAIVDLANAILSLSPVSKPHYLSAQTYHPV